MIINIPKVCLMYKMFVSSRVVSVSSISMGHRTRILIAIWCSGGGDQDQHRYGHCCISGSYLDESDAAPTSEMQLIYQLHYSYFTVLVDV